MFILTPSPPLGKVSRGLWPAARAQSPVFQAACSDLKWSDAGALTSICVRRECRWRPKESFVWQAGVPGLRVPADQILPGTLSANHSLEMRPSILAGTSSFAAGKPPTGNRAPPFLGLNESIQRSTQMYRCRISSWQCHACSVILRFCGEGSHDNIKRRAISRRYCAGVSFTITESRCSATKGNGPAARHVSQALGSLAATTS